MKLAGSLPSTLLILCFLDTLQYYSVIAYVDRQCPLFNVTNTSLKKFISFNPKDIGKNVGTKNCGDACVVYACGTSNSTLTTGGGCDGEFMNDCSAMMTASEKAMINLQSSNLKYFTENMTLIYFAGCQNATESDVGACVNQMFEDGISELKAELIATTTTTPKASDDANGAMIVEGIFGIAWILAALIL